MVFNIYMRDISYTNMIKKEVVSHSHIIQESLLDRTFVI